MKKISIGSWAYAIGPYQENPIAWDEVVRKLKVLGFDGVELGGFGVHPNPDNLPTPEDRALCRSHLHDNGLEWSGLAANLWGEHLIDTEDASAYIKTFQKNIDFCVDLGIPSIRVDTVQPPTILDKMDVDTARYRVVSTWKKCVEKAADCGLYVTWEFEPGFAFNKPSDILRIVEEVNHDHFGVLFDTCHGHMVAVEGARQPGKKETLSGGVVEFINKLHGKINHIHLIDSDGTLHDNETSTHAPLGDGLLNFDEILPVLNKAGVPHDWWTIDLCFWPDAWAVTEKCKKATDRLNEIYGGQ